MASVRAAGQPGGGHLRAVRRFGNGTDSLTAHIVKYEVKDRNAVHIESGDIGRLLSGVQGVQGVFAYAG